jgi:hypothetical protein
VANVVGNHFEADILDCFLKCHEIRYYRFAFKIKVLSFDYDRSPNTKARAHGRYASDANCGVSAGIFSQ